MTKNPDPDLPVAKVAQLALDAIQSLLDGAAKKKKKKATNWYLVDRATAQLRRLIEVSGTTVEQELLRDALVTMMACIPNSVKVPTPGIARRIRDYLMQHGEKL